MTDPAHRVNRDAEHLLAANERLLALRRRVQAAANAEAVADTPATGAATSAPAMDAAAQANRFERRRRQVLGGERVSRMRQLQRELSATLRNDETAETPVPMLAPSRDAIAGAGDAACDAGGAADNALRVYPSILSAMLKRDLTAAGRVWLLCRHLDAEGCGWLDVGVVRQALTRKGTPLRICGWRRLRQILRQGQGIFWQRDGGGRLWLRGAAQTAQALNVARLHGSAVDLPLTTLLQGMQTVRAHFYAAFHSGRRHNNPISRATLAQTTGVPARTQRLYDAVAGVRRQRNLAVGARYSAEASREQAWRRGGAVFPFVDSGGRQGPKARCYIAWQLPNSYEGPHERRGCRRQKALNRQLADLAHQGTWGNGQERSGRVFWPTGSAAARACSKQAAPDLYWPQRTPGHQGYVLWYAVAHSAEG